MPDYSSSPVRSVVGAICALALIVGLLFVAPPASGLVSCSFAEGRVTVPLTADGDFVIVEQGESGEVLVEGIPCGAATVGNTTTIDVSGGPGNQAVFISLHTGNRMVDWGSINWTVSLGPDLSDDQFEVINQIGDGPIHVVLGASGVDLNADGNLDVVVSGADKSSVSGSAFVNADDIVNAAGNATTGAPWPVDLLVDAQAGNDSIIGGNGDDWVFGGPGDDVVDGGGGTDTWFDMGDLPVIVDLAIRGPQNTGGAGTDTVVNVENIQGGLGDDTLLGNSRNNSLFGSNGDDFLDGRLGPDVLDGGNGTDTCVPDGDTLISCEGSPQDYVALGDSFSSGTGAGTYDSRPSGCRRSFFAYPRVVAREEPAVLLDVVAGDHAACHSAVVADVTSGQLARLTAATDIVTITIGGNDMRFVEIVIACAFSPVPTTPCLAAIAAVNRKVVHAQLRNTLTSLYRSISAAAPNARIFVLGYPLLLSAIPGDCAGLNPIEQVALRLFNVGLNSTIDSAVRQAGRPNVFYLNVNDAFQGSELCTSNAFVNGIVLGRIWESFHPNLDGHDRLAECLALAIETAQLACPAP